MARVKDWIKLLRIYQWTKSSFILLPGIFSGKLFYLGDDGLVLDWTNIIFIFETILFFSLTASVVYLLNDVKDRELDAADPIKKNRPVASGRISVGQALIMAVCLATVVLIWLIDNLDSGLIYAFATYLGLNFIYNLKAKEVVLLDVFMISIMFVVRVVVGAVAIDKEPSPWLFACTFFLALFLGFSKRLFEAQSSPEEEYIGGTYTISFLNNVISITAGVALLSYSMYTLQEKWDGSYMYATIPLVAMGIFRYLFVLFSDEIVTDKNPSAVLIKDKLMLGVVNLWLIIAAFIYINWPPKF